MVEDILKYISELTPFWLYVALFFFSFVENVFPPSPSDLVVVIGGSLIAEGTIHFVPTLLLTTIGSVIGFMTLFFIGSQLDKKVVHAGKIKFISVESVDKVENWFLKYGYYIILANRFLPGTRSVISFFAGLSRLDIKKTTVLCAVSAIVWNAMIIYLGMIFGYNIEKVDYLISTYNNVAIIITIVVVLFFVIRFFIQRKKKTS
jgi:membrane protein DedA with SNARE-associated domain